MSDAYKIYASQEYVDEKVNNIQSVLSGGEPHQMLVTDVDGKAVWEDRIGYISSVNFNALIPETTFEFDPNDGSWQGVITEEFCPDMEYTVIWNGISYFCVCKSVTQYGMEIPYLGDISMMLPDIESTGEPFIMMALQGMCMLYAIDVIKNPDGDCVRTFTVGKMDEVISKIPEKFIPDTAFAQSDWETTDEEDVSFIKNRPCGDIEHKVVNHNYEYTKTFTINSNSTGMRIDCEHGMGTLMSLEGDTSYHVKGTMSFTIGNYDPIVYEINEVCFVEESNYLKTLDLSSSYIKHDIEDSDLSFYHTYIDFQGSGAIITTYIERKTTGSEFTSDITCTITDMNITKIILLDEKYIPSTIARTDEFANIKWNDIKERPFGLLEETTINWSDDMLNGIKAIDADGNDLSIYRVSSSIYGLNNFHIMEMYINGSILDLYRISVGRFDKDGWYICHDGFMKVVIVSTCNYTCIIDNSINVTFPLPGVYFIRTEENSAVSRISFKVFNDMGYIDDRVDSGTRMLNIGIIDASNYNQHIYSTYSYDDVMSAIHWADVNHLHHVSATLNFRIGHTPIANVYYANKIERKVDETYGPHIVIEFPMPNGSVYKYAIDQYGGYKCRKLEGDVAKPSLPTPTTSNAGNFLRVDSNGMWILEENSIPVISTAAVGQTIVVKAVDDSGKPTEWEAVDPWVITSSTEGSTKKFKLTIDDSGVLTATEITE